MCVFRPPLRNLIPGNRGNLHEFLFHAQVRELYTSPSSLVFRDGKLDFHLFVTPDLGDLEMDL